MRIAALYDIHGNLPALEAVAREIRQESVDTIVVGGDVLPGPMVRECLELLAAFDEPVKYVIGNCDREVLERMQGRETDVVPEQFRGVLRFHARELEAEHEALIAGWHRTVTIGCPGIGDVLFCHATPRDDNEIFTRETPEERIAEAFSGIEADLVVCGHTHMQFDRRIAGTRVVNAGSVGMPFGEPGAYWMLIDGGVGFRRTKYDLEEAARLIRATDYPEAEPFANDSVLNPASEEEMIATYERFISRST